MTVRTYRKGDWVGIADLWRRNPSEETPVLGLSPEAVARVLKRTEGAGVRLVFWVAQLFRRPIATFVVTDLHGQIVGTTMMSFFPDGAYIWGVNVDAPRRRQGHARAMLEYAEGLCRRTGRPNVLLDVFEDNTPALTLYERLGFEPLRNQIWMLRALGPAAPLPPVSGAARIRSFRPSDGDRLAEIDNARMSAEVRARLARRGSEFRGSPASQRILESESAAWVLERSGQPAGFVRATSSRLMEAASLSVPIFSGTATEAEIRDTILTALHWVESRRAIRVITWLPDHQLDRQPVLEALGFAVRFHDRTMVHRLRT